MYEPVPNRAKDTRRTTEYQHPHGVVDSHEACPTCWAWEDADAAKNEWRGR
jgi:hypothetical protein